MMTRRLSSCRSMAVALAVLGLVGARRTNAQQSKAPVATVVAIRGSAQAVGTGAVQRALKIKSPLYRSDTIKTGQRGRIQIMFTDRTMVSLGRSTTFEIRAYEYDPAKSAGTFVTHVEEGIFRVLGGGIAKLAPQDFKVETTTATIGIRGSSFMGTLAGGRLTVIFLGGVGIVIDNQAGTLEIRRPNFGTVVRTAFARPQRARRFTVAEIRGLIDHLMGIGETPDEKNVPGTDDKKPGSTDPAGNQQTGDDSASDDVLYELAAALVAALQEDSTQANQNTNTAATDQGGPQEPAGGPDQTVPTQQHHGHAVTIAELSAAPGRRGGSGSDVVLRNHDDPNSTTDNPSDYLQFSTKEGDPGSLDGTGTLELGDGTGGSTGTMEFSETNTTRGAGDYTFAAEFSPGTGTSVNNLSGAIKTGDKGIDSSGGRAARAETWWNWGIWDIDFDNGVDRYTTAQLSADIPAGYWCAGVRTAQDYINSQINNEAVGLYNGGARCIERPISGSMAEYTGNSSLLVDFGARAVTGQLDFTGTGGPSMGLSATIGQTTRDFQGTILDVTTTTRGRDAVLSSRVDGSFFGPTANGVGGTFDAQTSNASYIGVFGADTD